MIIICFILAALIPYFICSINTAIIVTKIKTGEDIRSLGSGNAGLTNTLRTQGTAAAVFVLLGDVLKGVLSIVLVRLAFMHIASIDITDIASGMRYAAYMAGLFAVLGHVFPVYYQFKGGKGALVTVSVLYAVDPVSASILLGIFLVIVAVTRYVSLGSVIAGSLYPFCVLLLSMYRNDSYAALNFIFGIAIAFLLVFMHRENIKRLRNKTEKKLGEKTKEKL